MIPADRIMRVAANCQAQLIAWRRQFHQYPELGLACHRTAEIVAAYLRQLGLEVRTGLAETGVVGILHGKKAGPVVALRVDMDGLPIQEETGLAFASTREGIMHACGHDGHTAIGLGVATVLAHLQDTLPGSVKFIFQPGEESPGGAKLMIAEGVLENPAVDLVVGFHIYPSLPSGIIGIRSGAVTAGCYDFQLILKGTGGHAARPYQTKDPITAAGYLIVALQTIVSRRMNPLEPLVVSISEIRGGAGFNVIPEEVSLKGTIRYVSEMGKQVAVQNLENLLRSIQTGFDVNTNLTVTTEDPPLHINDALADKTEGVLTELFGEKQLCRISQPSMGAEDFAFFSEKVPCVYFRLGSYDELRGYTHDLHTPSFDFDETLLLQGTRAASFLILRFLEGDVF